MASGKQPPEYRKIQDKYADLCNTLTDHVPPGDLANKLFQAKLIGKELQRTAAREIVDEKERINKLLAAVHNQIELKSANFYKFIKILEEYTELEELLKDLRCKKISRFCIWESQFSCHYECPLAIFYCHTCSCLVLWLPRFCHSRLDLGKGFEVYFLQSHSMPPAIQAILGEDVLIRPCFIKNLLLGHGFISLKFISGIIALFVSYFDLSTYSGFQRRNHRYGGRKGDQF